jgi:ankyrin repeat protein
MACIRGHYDMVHFLLERGGANVNAVNGFGYSPLDVSAHYNQLEITYLLLMRGANVHAKHGDTGYTAVHWSCLLGHLEIARALADRGANVNERNARGSTPLHCACYGRDVNLDLVKFLVLDRGADPNVKNSSGKTPLDLVVTFDWEVDGDTFFDVPLRASYEFDLLLNEEEEEENKNADGIASPASMKSTEYGNVAEFLREIMHDESTKPDNIVPVTP